MKPIGYLLVGFAGVHGELIGQESDDMKKTYFITILIILIIYGSFDMKVLSSNGPTTGNYGDVPYYLSNGFGSKTEGGLNGKVIKVTNLNKSGPGSLKAALEASGPRLVVFEVGGLINLERSNLTIKNPHITIAGQTAPPPGITIIRGGITVQTHDVVMQHLAVRPGDAGQPAGSGWEPDGITTSGTVSRPVYNVVFDHISATWGVDENLSVSGPRDLLPKGDPHFTSHDVTLYKCLIAQGLGNSSHSKGEHSKGTLIHDSVYNVSIIGCLYAHNKDRNPRFKGGSKGVLVNCVIYNYGSSCVNGQTMGNDKKLVPAEMALVGNFCIRGKSSTQDYFLTSSDGARAYLADNRLLSYTSKKIQEANLQKITKLSQPPLWPAGLTPKPALQSLYDVLMTAGARAKERDPIDSSILKDVINGAGRLIDSQEQAGGYPDYSPVYRSLKVPEGKEARRAWLDEMAAAIDTASDLDFSPLKKLVNNL